MLNYLFILLAAALLFPALLYLTMKGFIKKSFIWIALFGLNIAIIGLFMQQNFPIYYTVLAMLGLILGISVLLYKRQAAHLEEAIEERIEETIEAPLSSPVSMPVQQEAAATKEDDDFTLTPLEDDLDRWMAADQKDVTPDEKERE